MTWVSFMDFYLTRELGQEDTIMRNYDLLGYVGKSPEIADKPMHLWLALKRSGLMLNDDSWTYAPWAMAEGAQRIVNLGGERPTNQKLAVRLMAWYTWDRIRKGDLQQYLMKTRKDYSPHPLSTFL
jgi:hypothetical protein